MTTSRSGIEDRRASGGKLADDGEFEEAKEALELPDENAGFLYINVRDAIEVGRGFAEASGERLPAELDENIRPLRSLLTYSSQDGDESHFAGLLGIE